AGAMDLENQARIKELAEKFGAENLLVVLGAAEAEAAGLAAETVSAGDPTFAGPLAGVPLGLKAYHIIELKDEINADIYDEQCGMMEMVLDVDEIRSEMSTCRG
ncbi:MAG: glycine/sarcosine/betaine reductase complex selenoprotein A, partial [Clostridiales bacterium]|nr:glycine/sarcosine/betaine reductase complex selenoprotein A [Clostridiales bacterium]